MIIITTLKVSQGSAEVISSAYEVKAENTTSHQCTNPWITTVLSTNSLFSFYMHLLKANNNRVHTWVKAALQK